MTSDATFMRRAIRLGRRGLGRTSPNPPVGAVVVARGRIVGQGFHRQAGGAHGEIDALRAAGTRARGATLYVTLEPCNHWGRTPPCADAVIAAGIRRVVLGSRDPNPHVRGGGVAKLRRAGIVVDTGVETDACDELNAGFVQHVLTGRPLVTLKLASSLDGRIATVSGASRWISGPPARQLVHRLRNETDAVMVGAGTVIADDPLLTCRMRGGRDPLRVVVDGRLRVPLAARVLTNAAAPGTLVATVTSKANIINTLRARGAAVEILPGRNGELSLRRLLTKLGARGVTSVLIEGGATLAAAALRERVVDRLLCFVAPMLIGGDGRAMVASLGVQGLADASMLEDVHVGRLGNDVVIRANLKTSSRKMK